ncbi:MAG: thermonuclease family protein [Mycobacterium leprae]
MIRRLPRFSAVAPDRRHLDTYAVRFEGIDTLETHFNNQHQNLTFPRAARDHMLARMGFGEVTFLRDRPNKVDTAEHHPIRGYLLANGIESNGRVLAQVYPGEPELDGLHSVADGDRVFVDPSLLDASVNADLVRAGLAYAELYSTMPLDLIHRMRELVTTARADGIGLWPKAEKEFLALGPVAAASLTGTAAAVALRP